MYVYLGGLIRWRFVGEVDVKCQRSAREMRGSLGYLIVHSECDSAVSSAVRQHSAAFGRVLGPIDGAGAEKCILPH